MNNQPAYHCPWCGTQVQMLPKHEPNTKSKPSGGISWLECPVCCANTPIVTYGPDDDPVQIAYDAAKRNLPNRPQIVCLCGSTRFFKQFESANLELTLQGIIVLSIGCNTKSDEGLHLTAEDKQRLDDLHKRKIDICDSVLVLNVGGYIGESTRSEIDYSRAHDKPVFYWDGTEELTWPTIADVEAARITQRGERLGKGTPCPKATEERHE